MERGDALRRRIYNLVALLTIGRPARSRWNFSLWLLPFMIPASILCSLSASGQEDVPGYQIDQERVEIPFEYRQHQILVTVEANGAKSLTFLFDSGASQPVLDTTVKVEGQPIDVRPVQEAQGVTQAQSIRIDSMRMGPAGNQVAVLHLTALRMDLSQTSRLLARHIDGILGVSFLSGFVVEIDYGRRMLRFHRASEGSLLNHTADHRRSFLFDLTGTNPFRRACTLLVHGKLSPKYEYDFLLDTGFGGYVSVTHADAERAELLRENTPRLASESYSVTRSFRTEKICASFLTVGEVDLAGRVITIDYREGASTAPIGIVGNLFLQNYHVTIDFPHRLMLLERVTEHEEPDEANRPTLGITLRRADRDVVVEHVKHGSPARQAGLRTGDRLLALMGQRVEGLTVKAIMDYINAAQGAILMRLRHGVDPNLGNGDDEYEARMIPLPPLDWKDD